MKTLTHASQHLHNLKKSLQLYNFYKNFFFRKRLEIDNDAFDLLALTSHCVNNTHTALSEISNRRLRRKHRSN